MVSFYDYLMALECSVTDTSGNHCHNFPEHEIVVDGEAVPLCAGCYNNVMAGAYGPHLTPTA